MQYNMPIYTYILLHLHIYINSTVHVSLIIQCIEYGEQTYIKLNLYLSFDGIMEYSNSESSCTFDVCVI